MNSVASQSSSSGWVGGSPCVPKSSLVSTRPRPKNCSQTRLTATRAVSGLSRRQASARGRAGSAAGRRAAAAARPARRRRRARRGSRSCRVRGRASRAARSRPLLHHERRDDAQVAQLGLDRGDAVARGVRARGCPRYSPRRPALCSGAATSAAMPSTRRGRARGGDDRVSGAALGSTRAGSGRGLSDVAAIERQREAKVGAGRRAERLPADEHDLTPQRGESPGRVDAPSRRDVARDAARRQLDSSFDIRRAAVVGLDVGKREPRGAAGRRRDGRRQAGQRSRRSGRGPDRPAAATDRAAPRGGRR